MNVRNIRHQAADGEALYVIIATPGTGVIPICITDFEQRVPLDINIFLIGVASAWRQYLKRDIH